MRRWGYGLAGLILIAVVASIANPDLSQTQSVPSAVQTQIEAQETPTDDANIEASDPGAEPENLAGLEEQTETTDPEPTSTTPAATAAPKETGLAALLAQLVVEDEFPSGYDRDLFRHWIDADRDGCDARREALILEAVVVPTVGEGCSLKGGNWYSAYDGVTTNDPGEFDIDHMVALKEAWDSGAHAWDSDRRSAFANDLDLPQALIAVSRSSNRSKGADDPADWLPPLVSYHCQYIEDWMVVKIKWELSVDAREFNALRNVAAGC